jgi:hypothetical protein
LFDRSKAIRSMSANVFGGGGIIIFDLGIASAGATVITGNGLSGNGSALTPVILGGPLTESTFLTGGDIFFQIVLTDTPVQNVATLSMIPGNAELQSAGINGAVEESATIAANSDIGIASFNLNYDQQSANKVQNIASKKDPTNTATLGIQIIDQVDGIGLIKDAISILPAAQLANPNAYVTTDCLSGQVVGKINVATQTTTQTFNLYAVNGTFDQLLRIDPAIFLASLGGTTLVTLVLNYTDQAGTVRNVTLASLASLTTPTIPSQVIYAERGTIVSLTVTLNVPGAQYYLFAACSYMGVEN